VQAKRERNPEPCTDGDKNLSAPTALPGQTPATAAPSAMTPPGTCKRVQAAHPCGFPAGIHRLHVAPDPAQLSRRNPQSFDRALDQTATSITGQRSNRQSSRAARVRSAGVLQTQCPRLTASLRGRGPSPPGEMPRRFQVRWPGGSGTVGCGSGDEKSGKRLAPLLEVASHGACRCGPHPVTPADRGPFQPCTGSRGSFRLTDVFRVTPRPAPPGWQRQPPACCFPLIGSAVTSS